MGAYIGFLGLALDFNYIFVFGGHLSFAILTSGATVAY